MSKGLKYLASTRPEAVSGLLKFYGKSVKALDDKTRLLISIATKVAVGTERGLRQYAPQAAAAGASKEEILDAVLMAFPAAGLTKVVDAVQILLEMDLLPEIDAPKSDTTDTPLDLGALSDFTIGKTETVATTRGRLLVYRRDETTVQVYNPKCPHAKGDLSTGTCEGHIVECPVHHWRFDLKTGKNEKEKLKGLEKIPIMIENDRVMVHA